MPNGPIYNFARTLNQSLSQMSYTQALVRVSNDEAGWNSWNTIRMICNHSPKLGIVLEIGAEVPDGIDRWTAEPVKSVIVPTSIFIPNPKGFPVLSKKLQSVLHLLMKSRPDIIISSPEYSSDSTVTLGHYREYLSYLYTTMPEIGVVDTFAEGYHDHLQAPLQPLMDNLESATYNVFEKDPVKYRLYEQAVRLALIDRVPEGSTVETVIMVVGAGARGPLVDRCISAANVCGRRVRVYAIEKNQNAIPTLLMKKEQVWGDAVEVIHVDMRYYYNKYRYWAAPEQCDILVSELLGSFGDNELSPECLDGCQHVIKPNGISIPASYTSFLAPISSSKLYGEVMRYDDLEHLETPYVVKFRQTYDIAPPQSTWTFQHPHNDIMDLPGQSNFNGHNKRYSHNLFASAQSAIVHGVAGYFECVLYKDVIMSINPPTHSPDMFSWFPLFFPLKTPLYIPAGSRVDLHFWRCTDARKVWYEWSVVPFGADGPIVGAASMLQNPGGRSSWIGL